MFADMVIVTAAPWGLRVKCRTGCRLKQVGLADDGFAFATECAELPIDQSNRSEYCLTQVETVDKYERGTTMKIMVMNGSPRVENTAAMVAAFKEGAEAAGHEVEVLHVGKMKIGGCLACEYCHGKGEGKCVQKDDMDKVMPAYLDADMIVYASPIYYFDVTAQLSAATQRVYAIGKPAKATKAALLLSSSSPSPYAGAIASYKDMTAFLGLTDMGVITAAGDENGSEAKLAEVRDFAKAL